MSNEQESLIKDPHDLIRKTSVIELPKRFYKAAGVAAMEGGFGVLLDGRSARTPGRNPQVVPTKALAEALAAEWDAQVDVINPASMPMNRLVNSGIDGVLTQAAEVRAELVKYAGSDLLCYRADQPEGLRALQDERWDPPLAWAAKTLGAVFTVTYSVTFVIQPTQSIAAIANAVAQYDGLRLAALHSMTSLTGSVVLALAIGAGAMTPAEAWTAAHPDEDWNNMKWGADDEAEERRARRFDELNTAATLLALA